MMIAVTVRASLAQSLWAAIPGLRRKSLGRRHAL